MLFDELKEDKDKLFNHFCMSFNELIGKVRTVTKSNKFAHTWISVMRNANRTALNALIKLNVLLYSFALLW